jgi:hypothetical protein
LVFWGLAGAFVTEGLDFHKRVAQQGQMPAKYRRIAFYVAEAIRFAVAAILAVALGSSGQVSGAIGVLAVGAASPLFAEKLAHYLPTVPVTRTPRTRAKPKRQGA